MIQKAWRPLQSSSTVKTQSDRREQHTKNGGAPWLPEPSMENNDKHSPAQTAQSARKSAQKQHKTPKFPLKHRSYDQIHWFLIRIKQFRSKNRQGKQSDETPIPPFPRLSRHLELLPSSESFAFDWRYFHLHHTQVIFSPTPFIMFKCTFINTYIHFKPQATNFKVKPFFPFHKKVRIMRGCKSI